MAAVKVARLFLCFSNRWQVGPPVALLFLLLAAGVECRPSAPDPCMRRSVPSQSCSRFVQVPIGGPAAECVRPVVTGCDRAGPRAPARQMVVRITLCTCLEGREGTGNQPNPGFPRNPSLAPLPLLSTVCSIFFTHPPTPEPAPSHSSLLTVQSHTGAARSRPSDGCPNYTVHVP